MKALFYGTPDVAVPFLELLDRRAEVAAVVCQPDKPKGRGLVLEPPPVKRRALELGLRVLQPERSSEVAAALRGVSADLAVAVAYGKLLKADALALPRLGTLNVHFSLLPRYRGAAPVQWALARGETKTGVTVFWLDEGMDTGPIFLQREIDIEPEEDAPALMGRLAALGTSVLGEALADIEAGRARRRPQDGEASLAPLIRKDDGRLTWGLSGADFHNRVRAFRAWPKAYLELAGPGPARLLVLKTRPEPGAGEGRPGTILRVERGGGFLVQCSDRSRLWVLDVQPEGKKPVSAADFLNGLRLGEGDFLSLKE